VSFPSLNHRLSRSLAKANWRATRTSRPRKSAIISYIEDNPSNLYLVESKCWPNSLKPNTNQCAMLVLLDFTLPVNIRPMYPLDLHLPDMPIEVLSELQRK